MRVLLRNRKTRCYYGGSRWPAVERQWAFDFRSLPGATKFALEEKLADMEIVLSYDNPDCQIPMPVLPEWCLLDEAKLPSAEHPHALGPPPRLWPC